MFKTIIYFIIGLFLFCSGLVVGNIKNYSLTPKDFLTPSVAIFSSLLAATMVIKTINNNKRSERLKNTLDALNNELFKGDKRVRIEKACIILNEKIEQQSSFKALVRLHSVAQKFIDDFKSENGNDYDLLIDVLNYLNRLCYGVEKNIYEEELINQFLGETLFNTWWASMILIREHELKYLAQKSHENKSMPDFGSPYKYLYAWVQKTVEKHNLNGIKKALLRLNVGYHNHDIFRDIEESLGKL